MKTIVSRSNPEFKQLRALAQHTRERRARHRTLLDGPHLVKEYLQRVGQPVMAAVSSDVLERGEIGELLQSLAATPVLCFAPQLFAQIAPVQSPAGILAVIDIPRPGGPAGARPEFLVALDAVQDPGNLGAIIRTAAGAGADLVLLSEGCADPWSPRALRAAMGATFATEIHTEADLVPILAKFEGTVVATAMRGGQPPYAVDLRGSVALLLGSEGSGVSARLASGARATISIPLAGGLDSLNVGAAAAIIMFERARQIALASGSAPKVDEA